MTRSLFSIRRAAAMVLILAAGGCSWGPPPAAVPATGIEIRQPPAAGEVAAQIAVGQLGAPYRYGGNSVRGFDCSGLVQYAWTRAGKSIPRTTRGQWRELSAVEPVALRTGDVLFFDIEGKVSHVGLYLGDGRFVHAPATGRNVEIERLDTPFYRQAFVRAGRPR